MDLDGQARKMDGYAMAGLLAAIAVMAILMSVALPTWRQAAQREKEEELIFRGKQFARAIELFQRRFANAFPPNFDVLVEQRFLRRKYLDPMVKDGEFQVLYQLDALQQAGRGGQATGQAGAQGRGGQSTTTFQSDRGQQASAGAPRGGVIGVVSKSKEKSIRLYNGRNYYNEWQFVYTPVTVGSAGGAGGMQRPGQQPGRGPGGRGGPGGVGFPGGRSGPGDQGMPGGGRGGPGSRGGPGRGGAFGPGGVQRGPGLP